MNTKEFVDFVLKRTQECVAQLVPDPEGCHIERMEFRNEVNEQLRVENHTVPGTACARIEQDPTCVRLSLLLGKSETIEKKFYMQISRCDDFPFVRRTPMAGFDITFLFDHDVPANLGEMIETWKTELFPLLRLRRRIGHRAAGRKLFQSLSAPKENAPHNVLVSPNASMDEPGDEDIDGSMITEGGGSLLESFSEEGESCFDFSEN